MNETTQINNFDDLSKICRACLTQDQKMRPLNEISDLFTACTSIYVSKRLQSHNRVLKRLFFRSEKMMGCQC